MQYQSGWISLIFYCVFLILTDFVGGIAYLITDTTTIIETILRPSFSFEEMDLQEQLLIFSTYKTKADQQHIETTIGEPIKNESKQQMIYIYNTHQNEKYTDGKTVVDASIYLAELFENKGFKVIVELNDFNQYAKKNSYSYDELYEVSRFYFKQAIETYGNFDYVIDLHRDGVGSASTSVVSNEISYAKMMFVVSEANIHYELQNKLAKSIMKVGNEEINGVFKNINKKYYTVFNQDLLDHVFLIEMGSNNNNFTEVKNSLEVFVESFIEGVTN